MLYCYQYSVDLKGTSVINLQMCLPKYVCILRVHLRLIMLDQKCNFRQN